MRAQAARTPQWLRTTIATIAMLAVAQLASLAYAPTVTLIPYAGVMAIGMVLLSAVLPHLVGSKTPPWRTVVWATLLPFFAAYIAFSLWETRRTMEIVAGVWLAVLWLRLSGWGSYWWQGATAPARRRWVAWRDERTLHNALSGGYVSQRALDRLTRDTARTDADKALAGVPRNIATPIPTAAESEGAAVRPPRHRAAPAKKRERRAQRTARRQGRKR